jgi:Ni,Fe-hydrogenase I large subunit
MLIHRVQLSEGLIVDYEISAPTDVNFAPGGPASQALAACLIEGEEELELISGLLVESFDPCVTYTLRMQ